MPKKIQNNTDTLVIETLRGYTDIYSDALVLHEETRTVQRRHKKEKGKVKVILGGGSGHEPAPIGFVGTGMLDAAIMGEVYTAPSGRQMFKAIQAIDDGSPILLGVMNHAGDQMNANIAVQMAQAEGIDIHKMSFYDDVASAPKGKESTRRGIGGGILFNKIVGAAAEMGMSIEPAKQLFEKVRDHTRTFAVAITKCTHPVTGLDIISLPDDQIELGMGIHGEGGSRRSPMLTSRGLAKYVLNILLEDMPVQPGEQVLVFLNGAGAATTMELSILFGDVKSNLEARGISIYGQLVGNIATTQELGGFSLSICRADEQMRQLWDAPCQTPIWTKF